MFPPGGSFQEEIFTFQSTPADSNMPAGNFQICLRPMPYRCKKKKNNSATPQGAGGKKKKTNLSASAVSAADLRAQTTG